MVQRRTDSKRDRHRAGHPRRRPRQGHDPAGRGRTRSQQARLHIVEFRGFERFIQGRPFWEVPVLVQRLCGICPVSHHLAAAKAMDRIVGGEKLTPDGREDAPADALRADVPVARPALLPPVLARTCCSASTPTRRSATSSAWRPSIPDLAVQGVMMRKYGQEIIKATAGKKIHGTGAIPGGINKNLSIAERDAFLKDLDQMIEWSRGGAEDRQGLHRRAPARAQRLRLVRLQPPVARPRRRGDGPLRRQPAGDRRRRARRSSTRSTTRSTSTTSPRRSGPGRT